MRQPLLLLSIFVLGLCTANDVCAQTFDEVFDKVNKGIDSADKALDTTDKAIDTADKLNDFANGLFGSPKSKKKKQKKGLQPLTKEEIVKMWLAKVSSPIIVKAIEKRKCDFYVEPDEIIYLKNKGFDDAIITAMIEHSIHGKTVAPLDHVQERITLEKATDIRFGRYYRTYVRREIYEEMSFTDYAYAETRKERNMGLGLTIAGGILAATGAILGPLFILNDNDVAAISVMVPTLTLGVMFLGPGIPFLARGNSRLYKLETVISNRPHSIKLAGISPLITMDKTAAPGAMVRFSF